MAKSKFRPLHDRVVVKRIDAEEKTKGGIIIPDSAKEKPQQGEITAVGPGGRDEAGKLIPIDVRPGDRVLFGKWSGTEVKIDGVEYLIMKEADIMGVLVEAVSRRIGRCRARKHDGSARFEARPFPPRLLEGDELRWSARKWLPKKSDSRSMLATRYCAVSTYSPTRCE